MKILISAYACEPGMGSEPGVGWNLVRKISRHHEVWAITRANNREIIENALEEESLQNVHFVYYDLPNWLCFWKRGQLSVQLYYYLWQLGIYRLAKTLHKEIGFDLVHHVTFVVYWKPSGLSLLKAPFFWGPVGGGESSPRNFWKEFSFLGRLYENLREFARRLSEMDPFVKITARKSVLSLATTKETKQKIEALGAKRVDILSQVALPLEEIELLGSIPIRKNSPFRVVSIGRLIHWKGFALALKAFAHFNQKISESEFWFIGNGPEKRFLEELTRRLGIKDKITFWGQLPRSETLRKIGECDIFVFPSLHESGGWACLEAMAAGRPVICLDLGGPALQVTEETGFKVHAGSPEQAVADIANAMYRLATETDLKGRMAEAGRSRAKEEFSWEKRSADIVEFYMEVLL